MTATICEDADAVVRLVSNSGQSGTLSIEASRRNSPIERQSNLSHVDLRVSDFYLFFYPSLSRLRDALLVPQCLDGIKTRGSESG